jgi:hypothetical protein
MSAESCFEAPVPFDLTFAAAHNLLRNVAHAVKEASSATHTSVQTVCIAQKGSKNKI